MLSGASPTERWRGSPNMSVPGIQAEELKKRLASGENLFLLDVRDENEYEISNIGGHLIPLPELLDRLDELDDREEIIALCKMGTRSARAVQLLNKAGFTHVRSLTGGIHAWSDRVDPKIRKSWSSGSVAGQSPDVMAVLHQEQNLALLAAALQHPC